MAVPSILGCCVKYQEQKGITSQSSKLQEQGKLQEGTGHSNGRGLTLRKVEVVFISAATFFFPVILCVGHIPLKAAFHACGSSYLLSPGTKHHKRLIN